MEKLAAIAPLELSIQQNNAKIVIFFLAMVVVGDFLGIMILSSWTIYVFRS